VFFLEKISEKKFWRELRANEMSHYLLFKAGFSFLAVSRNKNNGLRGFSPSNAMGLNDIS
jgi:hypothetical protein